MFQFYMHTKKVHSFPEIADSIKNPDDLGRRVYCSQDPTVNVTPPGEGMLPENLKVFFMSYIRSDEGNLIVIDKGGMLGGLAEFDQFRLYPDAMMLAGHAVLSRMFKVLVPKAIVGNTNCYPTSFLTWDDINTVYLTSFVLMKKEVMQDPLLFAPKPDVSIVPASLYKPVNKLEDVVLSKFKYTAK